jgi:hypothetical protein
MLYSVKIVYDDGRVTDEIISSQSGLSLYPVRDSIRSSVVSVHKYEVEGSFHPGLLQLDDGKKYIIPKWTEVHPETTYDDIIWIQPKQKKVIEQNVGSVGTYKTVYDPNKNTYKCSCMGFWRSKGNCKHVRALKEKNLETKVK